MSETTRNRLMLGIALVLAAIYLFPLYWMYITTVKSGSAMFATPPSFWPSEPQWAAFPYVWESRNLARYMWNSLVIAFGDSLYAGYQLGPKEGLAPQLQAALRSYEGRKYVGEVRGIGLIGAIELDPIAGEPTKRAFNAFLKAYDDGLLIRTTGDIIAMSPPLIISKAQIDELIGKLGSILKSLE